MGQSGRLRTLGLMASTAWALSLLVLGMYLCRWMAVMPGLAVTAMGYFVLMDHVLDDLVKPVKTDVTGLLKLTAALLMLMAGACTLWQWWSIL